MRATEEGGGMSASSMDSALRPVPHRKADRLNDFMYCHHCGEMGEMRLLGKDHRGWVFFECKRCGGVVGVVPVGV